MQLPHFPDCNIFNTILNVFNVTHIKKYKTLSEMALGGTSNKELADKILNTRVQSSNGKQVVFPEKSKNQNNPNIIIDTWNKLNHMKF